MYLFEPRLETPQRIELGADPLRKSAYSLVLDVPQEMLHTNLLGLLGTNLRRKVLERAARRGSVLHIIVNVINFPEAGSSTKTRRKEENETKKKVCQTKKRRASHILDLLNRHVCISRDPHVILGLNINDGQHGMARVLLEHLVDLHCNDAQTRLRSGIETRQSAS